MMRNAIWDHGLAKPDEMVLQQTFDALCCEAAGKCGETVERIKSFRQFKTGRLVQAREAIVQTLIDVVAFKDCTRPAGTKRNKWVRYIRIGHAAGESDKGWHQISTPMMANLFGCDHSSIVLMLGRMRKRAESVAKTVDPAPCEV